MTDSTSSPPCGQTITTRVQLAALGLAVLFAGVTVVALGVRPDVLGAGFALPVSFSLKSAFFVLLLLASLHGLRRELAPDTSEKGTASLFLISIVALLCAVMLELSLVSLESVLANLAVLQPQIPAVVVTIYGGIAAETMFWLLRRCMPISRTTAAWVGMSAASTAALGYSIHCLAVSPTYILVAYGIPCAIVTGAAALMGPRRGKRL